MTCTDCRAPVVVGPRCKPCANRRRTRAAKHPLAATLCQCANPLIDGEDECVWCGHLILPADPTRRYPVHSGMTSTLGRIVPNVLHGVSRLAA